jgi:cytochrome c-type biogenesis protein
VVATAHLTFGIAFLAGLVSFVSPCVLPLVPAYLSFLTGSSLESLQGELPPATRAKVVMHALAFILGFTLVFVALGASASALGGALRTNQLLIARIGGIITFILGLQMVGILKLRFLMRDTRVHVEHRQRSYLTSGLVGLAFAAGWSPCIGPILAGILTLASQAETVGKGTVLLLVYSLGLAVPFLITALAIGVVLPALNRIKRFLPVIEISAGAFMMLVGVVLMTNSFLRIAGWFYQFVPQPKI